MGQRRPIKVKRRDVPHVLVLTLINDCLQFDYKKRPSFKEIEERLKFALDACNGDQVTAIQVMVPMTKCMSCVPMLLVKF